MHVFTQADSTPNWQLKNLQENFSWILPSRGKTCGWMTLRDKSSSSFFFFFYFLAESFWIDIFSLSGVQMICMWVAQVEFWIDWCFAITHLRTVMYGRRNSICFWKRHGLRWRPLAPWAPCLLIAQTNESRRDFQRLLHLSSADERVVGC